MCLGILDCRPTDDDDLVNSCISSLVALISLEYAVQNFHREVFVFNLKIFVYDKYPFISAAQDLILVLDFWPMQAAHSYTKIHHNT